MGNNKHNDRGSNNESALSAAITAAGITTPGPANAADIIEDMIDDQKEVLQALQESRLAYGDVEFASADGTVSDRFGKKSCAAIACSVPIKELGIKIDVTIWGRLTSDQHGTSITFEAGMPKGIRALDETGKDRLMAHVENAAMLWPAYDKTTDAIAAKLTGQTAKPGTANVRPKLVKRVQLTSNAAR